MATDTTDARDERTERGERDERDLANVTAQPTRRFDRLHVALD